MKKKYIYAVCALTLIFGTIGVKTDVKAATDNLRYDWDVSYNGSSFSSTYDSEDAVISNAMPGDTITYSVTYTNLSSESADFYMNADVISSLENNSNANGGAYSFKILNNDTVLFDSETVGGDVKDVVGLNQINGNEGAYFSLGSVDKDDAGTVYIYIALDGNSQTNNYMASFANLEVKFGAEATSNAQYNKKIVNKITKTNTTTKYSNISEKKSIVKQVVKTLDNGTEIVTIDDSDVPLAGGNPATGDSVLPDVICGIMFLLGLALIGWYIKLMVDKKKEVA